MARYHSLNFVLFSWLGHLVTGGRGWGGGGINHTHSTFTDTLALAVVSGSPLAPAK
jgi:hypothetical protein